MGRAPLVVDTETTGFGHNATPPRPDAVIQVGLAYRDPDGEVRTWSSLCNPGPEYLEDGRAEGALEVSGLAEDDVLSAPPARKVASRFWDRVQEARSELGSPLEFRSYNLDFDGPFLASEPWGVGADRWGPCIMKRATLYLDGPGGKWPKLEDAVRRLDLEWPRGPAHDAGVDSHAALLVDEALDEKPEPSWR